MRMTRAWLILADILVMILLCISFILYYLYPNIPKSSLQMQKVSAEQNVSQLILDQEKNLILEQFVMPKEQNESMSWEEFMKLTGGDLYKESYTKEKVYNPLLDDPLEKRLTALNAERGDPLYIRLFKEEALLEVWIRPRDHYEHLKDYRICAFSGHLGPKEKEGDRQSPEGFYQVEKKQLNPNSKFHLSFNLGYPNVYDRASGRTGSFLMIHGNCVSIGCYAMTDAKIEEIYALVESALEERQSYVPVHIFPFRMSDENMARYSENRWYDFWMNLKEGYDYFEAEKMPPRIEVKMKRYQILEAK